MSRKSAWGKAADKTASHQKRLTRFIKYDAVRTFRSCLSVRTASHRYRQNSLAVFSVPPSAQCIDSRKDSCGAPLYLNRLNIRP